MTRSYARKVTPGMIALMNEMKRAGKPTIRIAAALDVAQSTVRYYTVKGESERKIDDVVQRWRRQHGYPPKKRTHETALVKVVIKVLDPGKSGAKLLRRMAAWLTTFETCRVNKMSARELSVTITEPEQDSASDSPRDQEVAIL